MIILDNMKAVKPRVIECLTKWPDYRNDDYKLIATIWLYELKPENANSMSAKDFLNIFAKGLLTNPESIRRVRAKLQEDIPNLRGDKYYDRHKEGKDVSARIKKEL